MLPAGKPIHIAAQNIVLHEQHPAAGLHPDICNRLLDIYIDAVEGDRRVTKRSLLLMSQLSPVNVIGTPSKPIAISNWSLVYALKGYNVEESVICILRPKVSECIVHEAVLTDFFLSPSALEKQDEIAKRIKAICMHNMAKDADLRELIAPDACDPKRFFTLPERRRETLARELKKEPIEVRAFIEAADKPLGTRSNKQEPKKVEAPRRPIAKSSNSSTVNEPIQKTETSPQPYQDSLFQNQDR